MSADEQDGSRSIACTVLPDRMPRIPDEQLTDAQRQAVADIQAGPRGALKGPYVAILRSPGLMAPTQRLGEYIRFHCTLDLRINEMAALMCARHWTQQFEWHAHVPHALKAGLDASVIDAIADGRRPASMREDEAVVFDFLGELFANRSVCDLTYGRARDCFGEEGLMDLLGVAGYYTMLAMIMNVARTAIPEGDPVPLAGLPEQLRTSWPR
jgi:4-carboxymuconolactone decarboxylase